MQFRGITCSPKQLLRLRPVSPKEGAAAAGELVTNMKGVFGALKLGLRTDVVASKARGEKFPSMPTMRRHNLEYTKHVCVAGPT